VPFASIDTGNGGTGDSNSVDSAVMGTWQMNNAATIQPPGTGSVYTGVMNDTIQLWGTTKLLPTVSGDTWFAYNGKMGEIMLGTIRVYDFNYTFRDTLGSRFLLISNGNTATYSSVNFNTTNAYILKKTS
jgi:hypothetical protein